MSYISVFIMHRKYILKFQAGLICPFGINCNDPDIVQNLKKQTHINICTLGHSVHIICRLTIEYPHHLYTYYQISTSLVHSVSNINITYYQISVSFVHTILNIYIISTLTIEYLYHLYTQYWISTLFVILLLNIYIVVPVGHEYRFQHHCFWDQAVMFWNIIQTEWNSTQAAHCVHYR